ncbi:Wzz/FepE/Etk N-terminal domain-containing protein [Pseudoalteromonas pernae]|uniref:Wzz/FepE/Etk N-terminal domain-containing protein n=1 Tax=Pseudoalteromonas pernae TaxID=3118054 RepID=UPI003242549E
MSSELDLNKIIKLVLLDKYKTVIAFLFFSVLSVFYALSLPNEYTSKVVVSSNMDESKGAGALGSLSGLASMAGFSLGGDGMSPEVIKEALSSNSFLGQFVVDQGIAPQIMAAESYNVGQAKFIYDGKLYDEKSNTWVREVDYPKQKEPSIQELSKKFKENLSVGFDRKTKLISVSFTSFSPEFSKYVLDELVKSFNLYMRASSREEAAKTIKYLKNKLEVEPIVEVRVALQQLLEEQLKKQAFSETRTDFALKVLDNPLVPSEKSAPKRAIVCMAITLAGTLLFALIFLSFRVVRLS